MNKVTLKDIAQACEVSVAAVSLVLNGRPVRVSPKKRQLILDKARELNYVPNQIARSLVTQRSDTLGLIVPNIESRFFSSLAKRLERLCREAGYALLITNSDDVATNDADLVRLLLNRGADGLFMVVASELNADPNLISILENCPVPYVMVDRHIEGLSADVVRFDNVEGGYIATKHLIDAGHSRIAILANPKANTGLERVRGYKKALAEAGISFSDELVIASDYYIDAAYIAADELVKSEATAVVATSDNIALGALRRLLELGIRVPEDISLVSYDNSAADALFELSLTSIEQNVDKLAQRAMSCMQERLQEISDKKEKAPLEQYLLAPRLILKDSVCSPKH